MVNKSFENIILDEKNEAFESPEYLSHHLESEINQLIIKIKNEKSQKRKKSHYRKLIIFRQSESNIYNKLLTIYKKNSFNLTSLLLKALPPLKIKPATSRDQAYMPSFYSSPKPTGEGYKKLKRNYSNLLPKYYRGVFIF